MSVTKKDEAKGKKDGSSPVCVFCTNPCVKPVGDGVTGAVDIIPVPPAQNPVNVASAPPVVIFPEEKKP